MCIDCKAAVHQLDGDRRRVMIAARRKQVRADYRIKIVEFFKTHPCVDCGITDIRLLEFDHLGDKEFNIGTAIASAGNWLRIEKEIAKCEVRCANCHKLKTYERLGSTWHDNFLSPSNSVD